MFLARVLTGRSALSSPSFRRPPKDKRTGQLFDSVSDGTPVSQTSVATRHVGGVGFGAMFGVGVLRGRGTSRQDAIGVAVMSDSANVYVVFDPMQHYPEYVISY